MSNSSNSVQSNNADVVLQQENQKGYSPPTSGSTHATTKRMVYDFLAPLTQKNFKQAVTKVESQLEVVNQTLSMLLDSEGFETILQEMLNAITLKTAELLGADRTTIYLLDEDKNELWSIVAEGEGDNSIELRFPADQGIAGEVATFKKVVNIPYDFYDDPRSFFAQKKDKETGYRIYTMLVLPLLNEQGDLVAVVQLINKLKSSHDLKSTFNPEAPLAQKIDERGFTESDQKLFEEFAPSIRLILESSRAFYTATQKQRAASALMKATESLSKSSLDLQETLKRVMDEAKELMEADRSTLWLVDRDRNELWAKITQENGSVQELRVPMGVGFVGKVAETGEVLNIPFDLYAHPDGGNVKKTDQVTCYRTCSLLCMPVYNAGPDNPDRELIGVTQLLNKRKKGEYPPYNPAHWSEAPECWKASFNQSDIAFMEAFNIQAGVALQNAKLFETVKQQEQMQRDILRSLTNDVTSTDKFGRVIGVSEGVKRLVDFSEQDGSEGRSVNNTEESLKLDDVDDSAVHLTSLAGVRVAHSQLLKRHRESGSTPELLTEIEEFIYRGRATGALLDTDEDRWASQSLLDYWSAILYRAGREPPDATLAEFDSALAPELDEARCPYLGLEAFREEKSNLFYGRQRLLEKLVNHLKKNRLLAVVGSSGSGKSSVVLGGLLPALKAGALPGSENWHYYSPMVPGVNPLDNLARITQPGDVNATEWLQLQVESFQKDPNYLTKLSNEFGNRPSVLVVDQFEEVFTLCRDDSLRQAFIDNLIGLIQSPGVRHTVILTMRTDFESQVARVPVFKDLFEQAQVRVTALDASELREAIEKPAELVGLKLEEGLVEALLQDVLGEPAALPLLQFTLLKLWDNRERNRVTWETYKRLGGGRQALARSADEFYEQLIPEEQVTVKRILLRMVRPTEGLEVTSNRIQRKTLYQAGEARDRVDRVLDKLIQARLVRLTESDTPDDAQIEVAHEALVRNWPRLVEWLEDERVNLRRRWRLAAAAEDWQARGRNKSILLRGSLLAEAQRYEDLNALEVEFIQRSVEEDKKVFDERVSAEAFRRLSQVSSQEIAAKLQDLAAELQDLSVSQKSHLIEASTQICMQEQLDALTQIQLELEQGQEVADWLDRRIASLAQTIGQEALNAYPKIRDAATAKQIRIFYLSIRQFIERLSQCLKLGNNDSLETPKTPVVLDEKLYEAAFEKLKTILPDRLPKEGIEQLEDYINYLLESLPTYQHLSFD